jgi:hypothetical protein
MSTRIRFVRALDVFENFPTLRHYVTIPEDDIAPSDFVRALLNSRRKVSAVSFLSHILPRREAVWWARQCLAAVLGTAGIADESALAAEAWVRDPDEATRRAALEVGFTGDLQRPTTWLARAAGSSGGSMIAPEHDPILPALEACAQAASAAVVLAITQQPPLTIPPWIDACVLGGIRFAEGGEVRIERLKTPPSS